MSEPHSKHKGGLWDDDEWELRHDVVVRSSCPHTVRTDDYVIHSPDGKVHRLAQWICPRVVVAYNEGGYASTGVCLDCVLEEFR